MELNAKKQYLIVQKRGNLVIISSPSLKNKVQINFKKNFLRENS